jgi:lysophospholipase L1-like esterase
LPQLNSLRNWLSNGLSVLVILMLASVTYISLPAAAPGTATAPSTANAPAAAAAEPSFATGQRPARGSATAFDAPAEALGDYSPTRATVFLGDSLTDYYDLELHFPGAFIVNAGVAGNTTIDVAARLQGKPLAQNPEKLFLLIGVNDLRNLNDSDEDVAARIAGLITTLKERYPATEIFVESLYPVDETLVPDELEFWEGYGYWDEYGYWLSSGFWDEYGYWVNEGYWDYSGNWIEYRAGPVIGSDYYDGEYFYYYDRQFYDEYGQEVAIATNGARIDHVNEMLAAICADQGVTMIDVHSALADERGRLRGEYTTDGLHLSHDGYLRVTEVLRPYMDAPAAA